MTKAHLEKIVQSIYARAPKVKCKGLCQECCGPINVMDVELRRIRKFTGQPLRQYDKNRRACGYLEADGRCSIYEVRPLICRLWGGTQGMECPHGCEVENPMTSEEGGRLIQRLFDLSGNVSHPTDPEATEFAQHLVALAREMGVSVDEAWQIVDSMREDGNE